MPTSPAAHQSTATARIVGPIDLDRARKTRRLLLDCLSERENLLVDMSAVPQVDGAGAAILVEAHHAALKNGKGFALACVSESVMRVLRLARLDRIFTVRDCPHQEGVH